jgi:hypothetical protein
LRQFLCLFFFTEQIIKIILISKDSYVEAGLNSWGTEQSWFNEFFFSITKGFKTILFVDSCHYL